METIALFGGSFDPPHIGHEAIVTHLLDKGIVEKVVVMPTYLNPFKESSYTSASVRLHWLQQMFAENKNVIVESYEVDQKRKVSTLESVQYLLQTYKKIYLVIGADNVASLPQWYQYNTLKELVTFIVVKRDDVIIPSNFKVIDLDVRVSSTQLREKLDSSLLPKKCAKDILKFYKDKNGK